MMLPLIRQIAHTISTAHPDVLAVLDPSKVIPALKAGKPVAWIIAPAQIDMDGEAQWDIEFKAYLISPKSTAPLEALDDLTALLADIEIPLGITRARPDSLQLSAGPYWPALEVTFNNTIFVKGTNHE